MRSPGLRRQGRLQVRHRGVEQIEVARHRSVALAGEPCRERHADADTRDGEHPIVVRRLCQKAGLVKLGRVALDGTKIKANASKHKAMSHGRMPEREATFGSACAAITDAGS